MMKATPTIVSHRIHGGFSLALCLLLVPLVLGCANEPATSPAIDAGTTLDVIIDAGTTLDVITADGSGLGRQAPSSPAVAKYMNNTWGLLLIGFEGWETNFTQLGAEQSSTWAEGMATLAGKGTRKLRIEETITQFNGSSHISLTIEDIESQVERYFLYDVDGSYVTIGTAKRSVAVSANSDGTYDVWIYDSSKPDTRDQQKQVANGLAALKEVEKLNGFKDLPPHILMTALALAHTEVPDKRSIKQCKSKMLASVPPVCTALKSFCDCAGCLALGKQGDCTLCPGL